MIEKELMRKLQNREFGNIWNCGPDYDIYKIYLNDGSIARISEKDFMSILDKDEDLFDDMNDKLQN